MEIAGVIQFVGIMVPALALLWGVFTYSKQAALSRARHFHELRRKFYEDEAMKGIRHALHDRTADWQKIPYSDRERFLGVYEEIAISLNSGLMSDELCHYMFGYYALLCWDSDDFWDNNCPGNDLPPARDSIY